jgi:hypothetical protein
MMILHVNELFPIHIGKITRSIATLAVFLTLACLARADAVVTLCQSADDPGPGVNLRHALLAQPDPDTLVNKITFQCNGPSTIEIGAALEVSQATRIDGGNNITLIGTGSDDDGMINVTNTDQFLFLDNLTLRHPPRPPFCAGRGCLGGVVTGHGVTELRRIRIENSHNPVAESGTLNVFDSQFIGNIGIVVRGGGTITIDNSVFQETAGDPIVSRDTLTITNSQFLNNEAAIVVTGSELTIDKSIFRGNKGALVVNCVAATISNSLFMNNVSLSAIQVLDAARQITLHSDKFVNNSASDRGGAVSWHPPSNMDSTMSLLYSKFIGNSAHSGGAIDADTPFRSAGKALIRTGVVNFSRNKADLVGGAIHVESVELSVARGVFADNNADQGGAVLLSNVVQVHSIFANTLFVRNTAKDGSAFKGDNADFINSTVDSNTGLAIRVVAVFHTPVHVKFTNSIVSNNPQGSCGPAGLFDNAGHNIQFPRTDCGASIGVADPRLDTLYIPLPKSPPMRNGDLQVCMSPPISGRDVYGLGRPSGGACTIGAAEGDIEAAVRGRKGLDGICDCDFTLLDQLRRLLPFGR